MDRNNVFVILEIANNFQGLPPMLRAAALNNPAKGLPPLNLAHFFEKKWTKNFCENLR